MSTRPIPPMLLLLSISMCFMFSTPGTAQFANIPVPEQMRALDFLIGDWTATGEFRTPDHVGSDRTLWYRTAGGGITKFDGRSWTAFAPGESLLADSILSITPNRADPYRFTNPKNVVKIQDNFVLLIDEGNTSGSSVIYFDTNQKAWISTQLHAPTNSMTTATATDSTEIPVFSGRATDRRGERIFRQRFEIIGADHYRMRTDVSFDNGVTWIDDQIVQDIKRRG